MGGHEGRFSLCEQFWHGQGCLLFDVVHPALPLPTTASLTTQGALKDGFGEAVVACDMPELCKFQSLERPGRREDMRDNSAEILFQSFLQVALVSSSGIGRDVSTL